MNEDKRNTAGQKWRKAARFVLFWAVFFLLLAGVCRLMNKRHGTAFGQEVLKYGSEIQVAFAGSSHVLNGISPQQLWKEQGIRAQTIASHGETLVCTYWHLRNALDYMQPQIVFLDLYGISFAGKIYVNGDPRSWLDSLPVSRTKLETVLDLYGWEGISALWPFTYEHTRWSSLEKEDAEPAAADPYRGEEKNYGITPQRNVRSGGAGGEVNTMGLEYLERIVELCQEKNVRMIPLILPYAACEARVTDNLNAAKTLLQQKGLEVLDLRDTTLIDPLTDYADYQHLNVSGVDKITRWLGSWLQREAGVEDLRGNDSALTEKWNGQYDAYRRLKRIGLEESVGLDGMLVRLRDTDYSCILNIPPDLYLWTDDSYAYMRALLENLGIELTGQENETGLYAVVDSRDGAFRAQYGPEPVQTDWGLVEWQDRAAGTDKDAPLFRIDGLDYAFYGDYVDYSRAASVLIVENVTGNIISQRIYDLPGNF